MQTEQQNIIEILEATRGLRASYDKTTRLRFCQNLLKYLGVVEMILGLTAIFMGIIIVVKFANTGYATYGEGIWCGVLIVASGDSGRRCGLQTTGVQTIKQRSVLAFCTICVLPTMSVLGYLTAFRTFLPYEAHVLTLVEANLPFLLAALVITSLVYSNRALDLLGEKTCGGCGICYDSCWREPEDILYIACELPEDSTHSSLQECCKEGRVAMNAHDLLMLSLGQRKTEDSKHRFTKNLVKAIGILQINVGTVIIIFGSILVSNNFSIYEGIWGGIFVMSSGTVLLFSGRENAGEKSIRYAVQFSINATMSSLILGILDFSFYVNSQGNYKYAYVITALCGCFLLPWSILGLAIRFKYLQREGLGAIDICCMPAYCATSSEDKKHTIYVVVDEGLTATSLSSAIGESASQDYTRPSNIPKA